MKKHRFLVWFTFLILGIASLYAQQRSISGTVVDYYKEPLIGVTISIQGTSKGTITDADGAYSIEAS